MTDDISLATRLAATAASTIASATKTSYVHDLFIDADAGIFDVDCSGFLSYLIGAIAEKHYELIEASTTDKRPLARDFYQFAAALPTTVAQGWRRVERLGDVAAGDYMAWELPLSEVGDTGHCFVVAAPPVASADDDSAALQVYDSTSILHFDDSRADGTTGIGSGTIHFKTDPATGAPTAFRFDPRAPHFKDVPIAIARIELFSAS